MLRNDAPTDGTVTLSRDADLTAGANPRVVIAANVDSDLENREDLIVLNGSTTLARGVSNAESRVLLSTPPIVPAPRPRRRRRQLHRHHRGAHVVGSELHVKA